LEEGQGCCSARREERTQQRAPPSPPALAQWAAHRGRRAQWRTCYGCSPSCPSAPGSACTREGQHARWGVAGPTDTQSQRKRTNRAGWSEQDTWSRQLTSSMVNCTCRRGQARRSGWACHEGKCTTLLASSLQQTSVHKATLFQAISQGFQSRRAWGQAHHRCAESHGCCNSPFWRCGCAANAATLKC